MGLKGDLKAIAFLLNNDEKSAVAHAAQEVRRITQEMSLQERQTRTLLPYGRKE